MSIFYEGKHESNDIISTKGAFFGLQHIHYLLVLKQIVFFIEMCDESKFWFLAFATVEKDFFWHFKDIKAAD